MAQPVLDGTTLPYPSESTGVLLPRVASYMGLNTYQKRDKNPNASGNYLAVVSYVWEDATKQGAESIKSAWESVLKKGKAIFTDERGLTYIAETHPDQQNVTIARYSGIVDGNTATFDTLYRTSIRLHLEPYDWRLVNDLTADDVIESSVNVSGDTTYSGSTLSRWSVFFRLQMVATGLAENLFGILGSGAHAVRKRTDDQLRWDNAVQTSNTISVSVGGGYHTVGIVSDGFDGHIYVDGVYKESAIGGHNDMTSGLTMLRSTANPYTHFVLYDIQLTGTDMLDLHNQVTAYAT